MKYNIKLSNISFDVEINGEKVSVPVQPEFPSVSTPMPDLPISNEVEDITEWFYDKLQNNASGIVLNGGKIYRVKKLKTIKATKYKLQIICLGNQPATLIIGEENYDPTTGIQDGHLFDLAGGSLVVINNVNICQPPQLKTSQPWMPSLFRAKADPNIQWKVLVKDCDTTAIGRNGGFGLGFLYGSVKGNYAGLVNFKHAGSGLSDAKNEWPNLDTSLYLVYDNVKTDFLNQEDFGSSIIKTKGKIENGRLIITDDKVTTRAFMQNYNFGETGWNNNFVFLIHADRYTFLWDCKKANIDLKTIQLRPIASGQLNVFVDGGRLFIPQREAHAGMTFKVGDLTHKIIDKNRTDYPEWAAWGSDPVTRKVNELAYRIDPQLKDGDYTADFGTQSMIFPEQDIYLIFKGNNHFRTTESTRFGDYHVMQADIVGHLSYNHANVSIWARNTEHNGYYRQSTSDKNVAKSKVMHFVNCKGFGDEFKPSIPVTNYTSIIPMPKEISELL